MSAYLKQPYVAHNKSKTGNCKKNYKTVKQSNKNKNYMLIHILRVPCRKLQLTSFQSLHSVLSCSSVSVKRQILMAFQKAKRVVGSTESLGEGFQVGKSTLPTLVAGFQGRNLGACLICSIQQIFLGRGGPVNNQTSCYDSHKHLHLFL